MPPSGGISFLGHPHFDKLHSPSVTSVACDPWLREKPSTATGSLRDPRVQPDSLLIRAIDGCDVRCCGSKPRPLDLLRQLIR